MLRSRMIPVKQHSVRSRHAYSCCVSPGRMIRIAVQASSVEAGSSLIDNNIDGDDTCIPRTGINNGPYGKLGKR